MANPAQHKAIVIASQLRGAVDASQAKCFLCFGTLLSFIREREFSVSADVDIGIITDKPCAVVKAFSGFFGVPVRLLLSGDKPLQAVFCHLGVSIDLYFWYRSSSNGAFYYHTYDHLQTHTTTSSYLPWSTTPSYSIPEYIFKGTPVECFTPSSDVITYFRKDIRYGRLMNQNGTWSKPIPQCPEECINVPIPFMYGHCLDVWYPDWATKRPQFGVSLAADTFATKDCAELIYENCNPVG